MPKLDTSNLEKVANSYRVQLSVPSRLRPIIGKAKLVRGLKTGDLATANMLKLRVLHDFKKTLHDAERKLKGQRDDPLMAEALQWREAFAQEDSPSAYVSTALEARYDALIKAGEDTGRADAMVKVAAGRETPIVMLIDDWLTERGMKPRQVLDFNRAVTKLTTWLASEGHPPTIEGVTKRIASDYRMATFVRPGINPKTANKDISALSSLWKFAARRSLVDSIPWQGQSLPKNGADGGGIHKLPFEDTEVARLLTSNHASPVLKDAITILALSGMRVEELARMKVADLRLDHPVPHIDLKGSKTAAARRLVPCHSQALPIIRRRSEGKDAGDYLFHELPTPPEGSAMERGQAITKAFGRLRERLGIGERLEGQRQASKDLHSLRRWHASKCRDALNAGAQGFTMYTVADNLGHAKGGLGLSMTSHYAGKESLEAKAACVGAVRLPHLSSSQ
jgi:integrase